VEERVAEEVIALCRRGISESFSLPGDEIYCLSCVDALEEHVLVEGGEGTPTCGGEYQLVTKADLHSKHARCSRCGEPLTIEPRLSV
jgi:hypothetical protein